MKHYVLEDHKAQFVGFYSINWAGEVLPLLAMFKFIVGNPFNYTVEGNSDNSLLKVMDYRKEKTFFTLTEIEQPH